MISRQSVPMWAHCVCESTVCVRVCVVDVAAVHVVRVEVAFAAAATAKTVTTAATATSTFSNCVYVCSRYVNARSMYEHTCVHTREPTAVCVHVCLIVMRESQNQKWHENVMNGPQQHSNMYTTTQTYMHTYTHVQIHIHTCVCESVIERRPPVTSLSLSLCDDVAKTSVRRVVDLSKAAQPTATSVQH